MGVLGGLILKPTEQPIMSFRTDKNGIFDPLLATGSGTLKWVIDGITHVTDSPSVELIGDTVDVEVYANGIPEGTTVIPNFIGQNIIGTLDFSHFVTVSSFRVEINPGLTELIFSSSGNTSSVFFAYSCNLTGNLDLSGLVINGNFRVDRNLNLTGITFSPSGNTNSAFFFLNSCNLTGNLDLSGWTLSGTVRLQSNLNLTGITFSLSGNTAVSFNAASCNLTGTLDLSSWTFGGDFGVGINDLLTAITLPSITTGLFLFSARGCALALATVDGIYSMLNTYFSTNTPIKDLDVETQDGTIASPTGGAANTDIVNLDTVVYPATAFDFTFSIN